MQYQRRAVFLDRDGVLNAAIISEGKPYPPKSIKELIILPDVPEALIRLKKAGYLLVAVTNQPDVARGIATKAEVNKINHRLRTYLLLDDFRVCFHDDKDKCFCRKPLPGLLLDAARKYDICLKNSFMIGDRWRDIEAGHRATCKTIWINNNYDEKSPMTPPHYTVSKLIEAADWILA